MRICQCLPPKLVTNRLHLPGIEDELIHTDVIFKVVEEGVTDFVGSPSLQEFPFPLSHNKALGSLRDLFWNITEVCSGLGFSVHIPRVVQIVHLVQLSMSVE